jgi:hypothetical protein
MVFIDRRPDRPDRHLEWRVRFMGAGALLAILGIYYEAGWLIWVAIAALVVGFLIRFLPGGDEGPGEGGGDEWEPDPDDAEDGPEARDPEHGPEARDPEHGPEARDPDEDPEARDPEHAPDDSRVP